MDIVDLLWLIICIFLLFLGGLAGIDFLIGFGMAGALFVLLVDIYKALGD